jgi:hypothetical protein
MSEQERRKRKRPARVVIDVFPDPVEEAMNLDRPLGDDRMIERLAARIDALKARIEVLKKLNQKRKEAEEAVRRFSTSE